MKKLFIWLPCLWLGGCQSPAPKKADNPIEQAIRSTQFTQTNLALSDSFNQQKSPPAGRIFTHSDRIWVSWEGDAAELLAQLAKQRNTAFRYMGVRLPLPVNLHVDGVNFNILLRLIQTQIAWRATLSQPGDALTLYYMPPKEN